MSLRPTGQSKLLNKGKQDENELHLLANLLIDKYLEEKACQEKETSVRSNNQ